MLTFQSLACHRISIELAVTWTLLWTRVTWHLGNPYRKTKTRHNASQPAPSYFTTGKGAPMQAINQFMGELSSPLIVYSTSQTNVPFFSRKATSWRASPSGVITDANHRDIAQGTYFFLCPSHISQICLLCFLFCLFSVWSSKLPDCNENKLR